MYLGAESVTVTSKVDTASDLTIPAKATHAEIVVDTANVRYTMDNSTNPNTERGSIFKTTDPPKEFLIDDIKRIRYTQAVAGSTARMNIHYFGGRDI